MKSKPTTTKKNKGIKEAIKEATKEDKKGVILMLPESMKKAFMSKTIDKGEKMQDVLYRAVEDYI